MNKTVVINEDESAFLLVLLSEEETIRDRMKKICFPMDQIDLPKLTERFRRLSWEFHLTKQDQGDSA